LGRSRYTKPPSVLGWHATVPTVGVARCQGLSPHSRASPARRYTSLSGVSRGVRQRRAAAFRSVDGRVASVVSAVSYGRRPTRRPAGTAWSAAPAERRPLHLARCSSHRGPDTASAKSGFSNSIPLDHFHLNRTTDAPTTERYIIAHILALTIARRRITILICAVRCRYNQHRHGLPVYQVEVVWAETISAECLIWKQSSHIQPVTRSVYSTFKTYSNLR